MFFNFFKKFIFIFVFIFPQNLFCTENSENNNIAFQVNANQQYGKLKCQEIIIGNSQRLAKIGKLIKFDLEFPDQLEVDLKKTNQELDSKTEKKLFDKDFSLCLYIKELDNNKIKTTAKDISSDTIIFQKDFEVLDKRIALDCHFIADQLLPVLTGEKSICLNSLVYSKTLGPRNKVICISDYACNMSKTIVHSPCINIAPCWHTQAPIIFYSQLTKVNNRLMSVNLATRHHKVICSYDGLNMQPSFSQDGKQAVLCLSGGKNSELYLYDQETNKNSKVRKFTKLTNNKGNNSSPCLLDNGNVIFCSDFESSRPQIYYLDRKNKCTKRLTNGRGYCAAPSYCKKNNSIVYTRSEKDSFQIFSLSLDNLNKFQEKQITFTPGNKHEPSYSDCGNFVAFAYEIAQESGPKVSQLAVLNCNSGRIRVLTSGKENKNFPRWSNKTIL
ncbi:hypothetical protein K9L05_02160 [Candidatus Babeliales bacterium]|nr:hypothetical protein [Candidatus Babeliales bacterium]MCF7899433.1 hypothetical protein [Candidatus Babeliales bacterium]